MMLNWLTWKSAVIGVCLVGLLLVYVFQRVDYWGFVMETFRLGVPSATFSFVANRAIRMIINDLLCIAVIHQLFRDQTFLQLAWWIFMAELLVLLPIYIFLKLEAEGPTEISSPIYQPLHRMIVNPLLMITLMAGMYFQKRAGSK